VINRGAEFSQAAVTPRSLGSRGGRGVRPYTYNVYLDILMSRQQPGLSLFAIGLLGLGGLALGYGDFALVWQPVPAWLPARTAVAYASGVLMILLGLGLLVAPVRKWAVRVLLPYLFLWALLKVPDVVAKPGAEGSWLGLGELTLLLAGGWTLFAVFGDVAGESVFGFLAGGRGVQAARYLFAISIVPIGLSHIVYVNATAGFVPHWLPAPRGWAYLTGAGQIASGLGVLFCVLPRIAAWAEAGQITIYTFLVWLPALAAAATRLNRTAFAISWIFGAAAWVVAQNMAGEHTAESAAQSAARPTRLVVR
jgi:uncharacterized membrane protein